MALHKVVLECITPVMDAAGVQVFAPGDRLPDGHPDGVGFAWKAIAVDGDPEPVAVPVAPSEVKPVPSPPVVSPVVPEVQ